MRRSNVIALSSTGTIIFGSAQLPLDAIARARGTGIVRFEFAADPVFAERVLADWGTRGRQAVQWSLLLDYPFLVSYGTLAAALVFALAQRKGRDPRPFAGLALAAAGCDAVENAALLMITNDHVAQPFPAVAAVCAMLKFLLLAFLLGYLLMWAELLLRRSRA